VPAPKDFPPRFRAVASVLIHKAWETLSALAVIAPDDARGKRFHTMGKGSSIAFPPGSIYGEEYIAIGAGTMIGDGVALAAGLPGEKFDRTDPIIRIGDRSSIGRGSFIVGRRSIEIGDEVTTGPYVYITDHNHNYDDITLPITRQWLTDEPVVIGAGCWLGTGTVILPGARIGRNVAVAAGSVVRGEVPDFCVVAGMPAKVVRHYDAADGWVPPFARPPMPSPEGWR
jgi:acetyltransferase-like isoleucine patch superfamily enzyme